MDALIWTGTAVTLAGLAGLIWCIVSIIRARAAGLEEEALKARLQKIVKKVAVGDHVVDFAAKITRASRPNEPGAPDFAKELNFQSPEPEAGMTGQVTIPFVGVLPLLRKSALTLRNLAP